MTKFRTSLRGAILGLSLVILPAPANAMAPGPKTSPEYAATSLKGIADPDKPLIAIDVEGLTDAGTTEEAVEALRKVLAQAPEGYQLFALDSSLRATLEKRPASGLRRLEKTLRRHSIPYLRNDFEFTPYVTGKRRFSEIQLEKLKRLKFVERFPVVGVISRPVIDKAPYEAAGIPWISFDEPLIPRLHQLELLFLRYKNSLFNPDREQWLWDGLTNSRETSGNTLEFIPDNAVAAEALLTLVSEARTFIHVSNYALEDDPFGRRFVEALVAKSKAGVKVRMILDRITTGPYGSDHGLVWLSRRMIGELRDAGVELLFHELVEDAHGDVPSRDPLTRRHRKMVIVDRELPAGGTEVVAFGGSRVLASFSFENIAGSPSGAIENALGIGWGSSRELSFLVKGPVTTRMQERFIQDFVEYGGDFAVDETFRLLQAQPRYPADTTIRYVNHETYRDQNTLGVILRFLQDPSFKETILVNSFLPDERVLEAILAAARSGKKITWIMGGIHFQFKDRVKLVPRLLRAGVQVYLMPAQLQTKLYGTESYYAFGTHNLAEMSQRDTEDLYLIRRDEAEAAALDAYVAGLKAEAAHANAAFGPGAKDKEIERYAEAKLTPPRDGTPPPKENSYGEAFSRLMQFLWTLPYKY